MIATASLLADTICRTVELGVTITNAAVADDFTHLFCVPVTLTDPNQHTTSYAYDNEGQLLEVERPNGSVLARRSM